MGGRQRGLGSCRRGRLQRRGRARARRAGVMARTEDAWAAGECTCALWWGEVLGVDKCPQYHSKKIQIHNLKRKLQIQPILLSKFAVAIAHEFAKRKKSTQNGQ